MGKIRKIGDRKDGELVRDIDSMHFITPIIYPNRCDNEAFVSERIDITNLNEYLKKRNAGHPDYKYNTFQVLIAALLKVITLRPKLNRFVANSNLYQRNEVSASFVIKKELSDEGSEGLAFIHSKETDNLETVHNEIFRQVRECKNGETVDASTKAMDFFCKKVPRFISKPFVKFICLLDKHGKVPRAFIETDPYYSSVILTNLGSIRLHSGYHHLTNWGTTSIFVIVGEKKKRPFYNSDGSVAMKTSIDLGLTVDERIADGFYFAKTIRLLKKILENPEILERPFNEEIEY